MKYSLKLIRMRYRSKAKQSDIEVLIRDARSAGYTVKEGATTEIYRTDRRSTHGKIQRGLQIFDNGTACRMDTDLDVCSSVRDVATMRSILGI